MHARMQGSEWKQKDLKIEHEKFCRILKTEQNRIFQLKVKENSGF